MDVEKHVDTVFKAAVKDPRLLGFLAGAILGIGADFLILSPNGSSEDQEASLSAGAIVGWAVLPITLGLIGGGIGFGIDWTQAKRLREQQQRDAERQAGAKEQLELQAADLQERHSRLALDKSSIRKEKSEITGKAEELERQNAELSKQVKELEDRLAHPKIDAVTKHGYGAVLKEWNDSGPGNVLLYNIELQSFTKEDIERTWGGLARLENIGRVVLLLPEKKIRRWERVVYRERNGFFDEAKPNRTFDACQVASRGQDDPSQPRGIAFALYRFGDDPSQGGLHDKAVVFVLSEPFSTQMEPLIQGVDVNWWDYHHVLTFFRDQEVTINLLQIWSSNFDPPFCFATGPAPGCVCTSPNGPAPGALRGASSPATALPGGRCSAAGAPGPKLRQDLAPRRTTWRGS